MRMIILLSLLASCGLVDRLGAQRCTDEAPSVCNGEILTLCEEGEFKLIEDCSQEQLFCNEAAGACTPCGDGVLDQDEECDDGNRLEEDGCDKSCQAECGSGTIDGDEECDDGNQDPGDGCDESCQAEVGFSCIGEPSLCSNFCGNGTIEVVFGEECDDGNVSPGDNCDASCRIECGDSALALGETCDDGNTISGDGCNQNCQLEFCGDSIVNNNSEQCDDGNIILNDGCDENCITSKVTQLSVGNNHSCIITRDQKIRCWGQGTSGQLGYGNNNNIGDNETPASAGDVNAGGAVVQVSAGGSHTCALLDTGNVRCWGFNGSGQLGYGNTSNIGDNETPASAGDVNIGGAVAQISAGGSHTCALFVNGNVRCWGFGVDGALGYGNTNNVGDNEAPASAGNVDVGATVDLLTTGTDFTCTGTAGGVRCWGDASSGQLGLGNTATIGDDEAPSSVLALSIGTAQQLDAGVGHTCAVTNLGLICWGLNNLGQLGRGTTAAIGDNEPANTILTNVGGTVVQVAGGVIHTCARLSTGAVRCWGRNANGLLGNPALDINNVAFGDNPNEVPNQLSDIDLGITASQVDVGSAHSCALSAQGKLRCWGASALGQLGYGNTTTIGDDETPASVGDVPIF